jgi:hypothetical protein
MAKFDEVFADLQAKMNAAMAVIAQDPVMAAQVREAIDNAQTAAEIEEAAAQDDARANALNAMVVNVRGILAEAVGEEPPVEEPVEEPPVEEPVEEPPVEEPPVEE